MSPQAEKIEMSITTELTDRPRLVVGVLDIRVGVNDLDLTKQGEAHLLEEIADRIGRSTRQTDPKDRLSTDRFVVVLPGLGNPGDIELVAEGVHRAVEGPYETSKGPVHPRINVGAATSKRHSGATQLLGAARNAADVASDRGLPVNIAGGRVVGAIRRLARGARSSRKRRTDTHAWAGIRTERGGWRPVAEVAEERLAS